MKYVFFVAFILNFTLLSAQKSFSENEARQLINTFFDGFHQGDTLKMKSVMAEKVPMQTAFTNAQGEHIVRDGSASELLKAIANRTPDQVWEEKLLDYEVQVDGNLAHVWTPYEFWFNGQFSHCGANAFTLARTHDGWRIIHLIDSRRKESCGEE